ncbi:NAD(P)/FAD-dependent oxidoreductase [Microbacterium murale]|uniref:Pyridine nucleotide-disulfide oxidoreductase n=1 Tax=Microbacterium murale TaxID=1081040 RepID=A0ABQ1RY06_9MICO|nr:FAD/NAD(P)-binding oxidoreductase [Microbacterium murale]GGD86114.1 pyridine nucleotide-disulfide oxidoreductase [Microbacterium murale]
MSTGDGHAGAPSRIVVVGAQTAGFATVDALRAEGYDRELVLIGAERHLPYNRPSLSKQVLSGMWQPAEASIADERLIEALELDLRLGTRATGLDQSTRTLSTDRGPVAYDALVVATGSDAIRPQWADAAPGRVFFLRSLDDAVALERALTGAASGLRVAVVGTGLLGSEIAATLRKRGAEVTLVGRSGGFRLGAVGTGFSDRIHALHQAHGVRVVLGLDVAGVEPTSDAVRMVLSDGTHIEVDIIVAAVGSRPAIGWLAHAGLSAEPALLASSRGVVAPGVYAVGDAAAWLDPVTGRHTRSEHQQTAIEQAHVVAHLLYPGETSPYPLPFFWTELYGERVQVHGRFEDVSDVVELGGDSALGRAVWGYRHDGRVRGIVGWKASKEFRLQRAALMKASPVLEPDGGTP